jgi:OOP family OmpA-OmpF porin
MMVFGEIKMKKNLLLFVASFFVSTSVFAQESNWYMGASAGQTKFDTGITPITASLDDKDSGFKIFGGYDIDKNFSVEAHYVDFGEASLSGTNGQTFRRDGTTSQFNSAASIKSKASAWGVAVIAGIPVTESVRPFAKVGFNRVSSELTVTSTTATSTKENSTESLYGVGVEYSLTKAIALRIEYEIHNGDDDLEAKLLSAGLKFRF